MKVSMSQEFYLKLVAIGHAFLVGFGNDQITKKGDTFNRINIGGGSLTIDHTKDSFGVDRITLDHGVGNTLDHDLTYDAMRIARKLTQADREDIIHDVLLSMTCGESGAKFVEWCQESPSNKPMTAYFVRLKCEAIRLLNRSFRHKETDLEKADRLTCEVGTCEGILDALRDSKELLRIIELIDAGYTQKEIGKELGIRDRTVRRKIKIIAEVLTSYYLPQ